MTSKNLSICFYVTMNNCSIQPLIDHYPEVFRSCKNLPPVRHRSATSAKSPEVTSTEVELTPTKTHRTTSGGGLGRDVPIPEPSAVRLPSERGGAVAAARRATSLT
mmetsp:Transcript_26356/g.62648  ORF Transcript_26356/g.62648 Transcript_26356/m.62648 type:complete len:106 (-) Transcript_26356:130-447(-)